MIRTATMNESIIEKHDFEKEENTMIKSEAKQQKTIDTIIELLKSLKLGK